MPLDLDRGDQEGVIVAQRGGGSSPRSGRPEAGLHRIVKRIGLVASLGVAALVLSGCGIDNTVLRFGWPSGVTPQADRMRELWTWSVIAALIMGVIVWGLTFWTVAFHRKKKDSPDFPRQTAYNVPLELFYTAVPFVIIAVLFYFTVVVQNFVDEKKPDPNVVVDVTAYQWNWKFGYRTIDLQDGAAKYNGIDEEKEAAAQAAGAPEGVDEEGREIVGPIKGRDEQDLSYLHYDKVETVGSSSEIPVLVLPVGKRIEFVLASSDVIHGFWVPEFLFKRDVNPSPEANHSDNVFQISEIDREGAFVGRCAEMCGTYHSMMNFEVRAVSQADFQTYVKARQDGQTNGQALAAIGQSPVSTTTVPFDTVRTTKSATVAEGN